MNDIFNGHGIEIRLGEADDFLKVVETLQRIGISSKQSNTLTQSCHILHKQGRYAIMHFKELFLMDSKRAEFTDDDKARRNTIATLLEDWGLLKIVDPEQSRYPRATLNQFKIIPYKERSNYNLVSKYTIGKK